MSAHDCPRCGRPNHCGMARGESTCWCQTRPPSGLPIVSGAACLCAECLDVVLSEKQAGASAASVPVDACASHAKTGREARSVE